MGGGSGEGGRGIVRFFFFFSSRRRHTRYWRDWSSDVCSSDLTVDGKHTGKDPSRKGLCPPTRPDLASPGLGGQPLCALQGASAQLPPPPPSGSGSVQPVPREAPFRLHTPVSPTGRKQPPLLRKRKEKRP